MLEPFAQRGTKLEPAPSFDWSRSALEHWHARDATAQGGSGTRALGGQAHTPVPGESRTRWYLRRVLRCCDWQSWSPCSHWSWLRRRSSVPTSWSPS